MNASVDFSEVWKTEFAIYKNHSVSHETMKEGEDDDMGENQNN